MNAIILISRFWRVIESKMGCVTQVFAYFAAASLLWAIQHDSSFILPALLFGALAALSGWVREKTEQKGVDITAGEILEAAQKGENRLFYLYIRPFVITSRIPIKNPEHTATTPLERSYHSNLMITDLEAYLRDALAAISVPLIALGKPGESIGAGRILKDESEWKTAFEVLARRAAAFLVIPSHHEGTVWEIAKLRELDLISQCVFIRPRAQDIGEGEWEQTALALRQHGLTLPESGAGGLFFKISADGCAYNQRRFADAPWTPKEQLGFYLQALNSETSAGFPIK